jgi:DNA-binding response OmpR family regulator
MQVHSQHSTADFGPSRYGIYERDAHAETSAEQFVQVLEPSVKDLLRFSPSREFQDVTLPTDGYAERGILRVHDLEIDPGTRTVRRAGRSISLTPHEFSLLELLISRQGQIVTRAQIRDHLYKHNEHRSNVIDAHICYLRNKIDKGFDFPLILTRWGEGYLFRAEERQPGERREAANAEIYW